VRARSKAEPLDNRRGDPFGVAHGFIDGEVAGKIRFMHAPEDSEKRAQSSMGTFTGIAVNFTHAIAVGVTRVFLLRVTDGNVIGPRAIPCEFVTREDAARRSQRGQNGLAGFLIRRFRDPNAHLAGFPADHLEDGWAVFREGAVPRFLVGTPSRWVVRVTMGVTFFPPIRSKLTVFV
jgi:hypothetical protein